MSINVDSSEFLIFIPKGGAVSAQVLIAGINKLCIIPTAKKNKCGNTRSILTIHLFEYKDLKAILEYVTKKFALIIVHDRIVGSGFRNEVEYCDQLNSMFSNHEYIVLSISEFHQIHTEWSTPSGTGKIIRRSNHSETQVINDRIRQWSKIQGKHNWQCNNEIATYKDSTYVVLKYQDK